MSPRSPKPRGRRCPICGRPPDAGLKPFCSKACADADLARWLSGSYAIPAQESDEADSAPPGETRDDET